MRDPPPQSAPHSSQSLADWKKFSSDHSYKAARQPAAASKRDLAQTSRKGDALERVHPHTNRHARHRHERSVQFANGFFGTYISLRLWLSRASTFPALVLSAYFAGFTLGAFRCGSIIERIGHIRAYAAFAGVVAAAAAIMPLLGRIARLGDPCDRAIVGFGCCRDLRHDRELADRQRPCPPSADRSSRIYMVGTFLALALGRAFDSPRGYRERRHRSMRSSSRCSPWH